MVNKLGEKLPTWTACGAEAAVPLVTTTETWPVVGTCHGSWALICCGDTKSNGAAMLLKVTDTLPNVRGKGMVVADVFAEARLDPKIDTSEPGTAGAVKDAASTTPPGSTNGVWAVATAVQIGKRAYKVRNFMPES